MAEHTHDPQREIQKLRTLLAAHDKPLAFLFGAGSSCSVKGKDGNPLIPAVAALTKTCQSKVEALGDTHKKAWARISSDGMPPPDIESILSDVRIKCEAISPGDKLVGLTPKQLQDLEEEITKTIVSEVTPSQDRYPDELPHTSLARWLRNVPRQTPVDLFTLNYDTLLEQSMEAEWVPYFDGFVGTVQPFFSSATMQRTDMAPAQRWARLWKLHGSINWTTVTDSKDSKRLVRLGSPKNGAMILPSVRKYEESRKQPYLAMLDYFQTLLTERDDMTLITCGYSFRDQHVNELIFEALEKNPGLHVLALSFEEHSDEHEVVKEALRLHRLILVGPDSGVVSGRRSKWDTKISTTDLDRLEGIYEVDSKAAKGRMRIGDFNVFADLLSSVSAQRRASAEASDV